ncbi:hypothetical protein [Morganella morganii]|uniref:hypothetical protein n=1 Tax=Morganella morganii TaxID=582 RepID=UPI000D818562|nr:hypothetical protein [Morganella morganii]MDM8751672.1 hypothetical protein [Morganella morganii]SPX93686.1 Uncharacterised protein [Morganella morganii]
MKSPQSGSFRVFLIRHIRRRICQRGYALAPEINVLWQQHGSSLTWGRLIFLCLVVTAGIVWF